MVKYKVTISYSNYNDDLDDKIERTVGKIKSSAGFIGKARTLTFIFASKLVANNIQKRLTYLPEDADIQVIVTKIT
jgi:hypothetical protein